MLLIKIVFILFRKIIFKGVPIQGTLRLIDHLLYLLFRKAIICKLFFVIITCILIIYRFQNIQAATASLSLAAAAAAAAAKTASL